MNTSGLHTLSLYEFPSGFLYRFDVSLPSRQSFCEMFFSGESGCRQRFTISGGKLYVDGAFVGSHNGALSISGSLGPSSQSVYQNSRLLAFSASSLPVQFLGINSVESVSANYYITGPQLALSSSIDPFFENGSSLTASLSGLSRPFQVFSGYSMNSAFDVTGWTSGSGMTQNVYLKNNSFQSGANTIPVRLFTNLGTLDVSFSSSGLSTGVGDVTPFVMANISLGIPNSGSSSCFVRLFSHPNDQFDVRLDYLNGSGTYYKTFYATEYVTTTLSSGITGSGWAIAQMSGSSGTYSNLYHLDIYPHSGTEEISGVSTLGRLARLVYATGNFLIPFVGIASGYGTGSGYSGEATGIISGTHAVTILDGSGYYLWSVLASGNPSGNLCWMSGIELVPSGEFWGVFTGLFIGTGYYSIGLSGYLSGLSSGIDCIQSFTGSWNLMTGYTTSGVDFLENGYYGVDNFHNAVTVPTPSYLNSFYLKISYSNSNNKPMGARLSISGLYTGYYATISGVDI